MPGRFRCTKNPPAYTGAKLLDTVEAYVAVQRVPARLYHKFPGGLRSPHQPARGQGPARGARRSTCDDVTHHKQYLWRYDKARPITSDSRPFLAARETLSKTYLASGHPPVHDLLPDGRHSYK